MNHNDGTKYAKGEAMTLTREQIAGWGNSPALARNRMVTADIAAVCALALRGLDAEWRPIEEAPKDGTVVLVCTAAGEHFIAKFGDLAWWCHKGPMYDGLFPTHFMPLPAPPQTQEK